MTGVSASERSTIWQNALYSLRFREGWMKRSVNFLSRTEKKALIWIWLNPLVDFPIELSEGCYENLITNLPDLDFDIDDFKDLYHLRWNEETSFRDLKYPLCLKAFHSKNYEYIVQEVWARAILYNFFYM